MNDLISYSSSIGRLELHISFKIKYCHNIFDSSQIKDRCKSIFEEVASAYKISLKELGFDRDHIHMIIMLNPSMSVSTAAKLFKVVGELTGINSLPWPAELNLYLEESNGHSSGE